MSVSKKHKDLSLFFRAALSFFLIEVLVLASIDFQAVAAYADEVASASEATSATTVEAADDSSVALAEETVATDSASGYEALPSAGGEQVTPLSSAVIGEGDEVDGISRKIGSVYHYKDSYFFKTAREYNPSLSTMSLCLALAGFGTADDYAHDYKYAEEMFKEIGFVDIMPNYGMKQKPTEDSIGVTAARKVIKDEDGTQATLLAFTVRGGNYEAEWASNTKLGATGEAQGFGNARDQVVEHINDYIDAYRDQFVGKVKIWVVGFSRASATTNLTGNFLDCAVQNTGANTDLMVRTRKNLSSIGLNTNDDIYAYGFEVPKGGHDSTIYKAADNSNLWCIVDSNDLVPYVAPGTSGFDFYRYGNTVSLTTNSSGGEISYDEMISELARFEPKAAENFKNKRVYKTRNDFEMMAFSPLSSGYDMFVYGKNLDGSLSPAKTEEASSMSDFLSKLIDFVAEAGGSRENYANNLQPVVSELTRVIMGGTGAEKDALLSTLQDGFLEDLNYAAAIDCYMEIVHPVATYFTGGAFSVIIHLGEAVVSGTPTNRLIGNIGTALKGAFRGLLYAEKTKNLFTVATVSTFENKANYLAEFVVKFAIEDLDDHDGQFIGTTIHYMDDLLYAHEPDYVAAYLRLKDPNYSLEVVGDHQLTYSFDSEDSQKAHVMEIQAVYKKDNSATISLGKISNNAISGIPEEFEGKLSYSYVDGKNFLKVSRKLKEDYDIRFVITSTSSAAGNLQMKYRNCSSDGNAVTAGDQFFENTPIALSMGDTITLTCDDNEGEASFKKTIGATFDYGVYSSEEGSHGYRILGQEELDNLFVTLNKSDTKRSTTGFNNLDYKGSYSFAVTGDSGKYSLYTAYEGSYDANGNFVVGENGKYALKRVSNTVGFAGPRSLEWTMNNDFRVTTKHYLISLFDTKAPVDQVTVGAVSVQGESKTVLSGANYTVTNETTQAVSTEGSVEASAGDRITVSLSGAPDGYIFTRWATADESESTFDLKSGTMENTSFTFIMPEESVSLVAECVPKSEGVDVVVVGRWATEYASASGVFYEDPHLNPDGNGWSQTYAKPSSLGGEARFDSQGTHVFKRTGTEKADYFYIEAPASYVSGDGQVYSFDHWRVTTLDGQEYNEKVAEVMIPYYSDSGEFEYAIIKSENIEKTEPFAANGSIESYLVIPNSKITQSLRFEPVYGLTETYTYNVTLTNGNTVTGRVPAGKKVKIADVADSEHSFISWDASKYSTETVQSEKLGVPVPKITKSRFAVDNKYSTNLTFTMPQYNVAITAKRDTKTYSIKLSGEVSSNVKTAAAGDTVVLTSTSKDLAIGGWENPGNLDIRGCRNTSGIVDRYNFTMPNHDVTLTAITRPLGRHRLAFEGTYARIWDGPNSTGGYLYDIQEGQEVDVFPDYREGYVVNSWHIDTSDGSDVYSSVNDWGKLTLIMPNCNVYAVPVYTRDPYYVSRDMYSLSASSMESGENSSGSSEDNGVFDMVSQFFGLFNTDAAKTCRVSRVDDVLYATGVSAGITPKELLPLLPKTTTVEIEGDQVPANISWSLSATIDSSRDFIVTGTVEPVLEGTPYEGRTVEYAKGIDNGVTAFVSIAGQGTLPAPSLSEESDVAGCYDFAPTAVFDMNSGTDLYCYVASANVDPETVTAETVVTMGEKVKNNKCKLPSRSGGFVLYAVYKANSDTMREGKTIEAGTSGEVSSFEYNIELPEDGEYAVLATNASGSGSYVPGVDEVTVVADEPEKNVSFKGLNVEGGRDLVFKRPLVKGDTSTTFVMPSQSVFATATYTIDAFDLTVEEPVAGKTLASSVALSNAPSQVKLVTSPITCPLWLVASESNTEVSAGMADYGTRYALAATLSCEDYEGYVFNNKCKVTVNGKEATCFVDDDVIVVTYLFDPTDSAEQPTASAITGYSQTSDVDFHCEDVAAQKNPIEYLMSRLPKSAIAFVKNYRSDMVAVGLSYDDEAKRMLSEAYKNSDGSAFMVVIPAKVTAPDDISQFACASTVPVLVTVEDSDYFVSAPRAGADGFFDESEAYVELDYAVAKRRDAYGDGEPTQTVYYFTVGKVSDDRETELDPTVSDPELTDVQVVPASAIEERDERLVIDVEKLEEGVTYAYDDTSYLLHFSASSELQYLRALARKDFEATSAEADDSHVVESASFATHFVVTKNVGLTVETKVDGVTVGTKTVDAVSNQRADIMAAAPADGLYIFKGWTGAEGVTFGDATAESTYVAVGEDNLTVTANFEKLPEHYADVKVAPGKVRDITNAGEAYFETNPFGAKIDNGSELESLLGITAAEKAAGVNVWLAVTDATATMSDKEKELLDNAAKASGKAVGKYLTITLYKKVGEGEPVAIQKTSSAMQVSITVPESLRKDERTFAAVRAHDGSASVLETAYDSSAYTMTFSSDLFSSYAIAYDDSSQGGGSSPASEAPEGAPSRVGGATSASATPSSGSASSQGGGTTSASAALGNASSQGGGSSPATAAPSSGNTSETPAKTGDNSMTIVAVAGMLALIAAVGLMVVSRRRKKERTEN